MPIAGFVLLASLSPALRVPGVGFYHNELYFFEIKVNTMVVLCLYIKIQDFNVFFYNFNSFLSGIMVGLKEHTKAVLN